jgi:hypothetical protein
MLVFVEIEKPLVLSGWWVEQPENVLTEAYTDVKMLENPGAGREIGWLRRCHGPAGRPGLEAGADLPGPDGAF